MEWKDIIEKEKEEEKKSLEDDYQFVDQQLKMIEENKKGLLSLRENLENYEKSLDN